MDRYEEEKFNELLRFEKKLSKKESMTKRKTKKLQDKLNSFIPEKAHTMITTSIKKMVETALTGSEYITKNPVTPPPTMREKDLLVEEKLKQYRNTAALEGAGTGAGGIFLGLADFPLLLAIKIKFLFDAASIYGLDLNKYEERVFILYVFQLAFSSEKRKKDVFEIIKNWNDKKEEVAQIDWRMFQQEYRDYLDIVKLLQLIPGFGAFVGAIVNHRLLDELGNVALQCFRLRYFSDEKGMSFPGK